MLSGAASWRQLPDVLDRLRAHRVVIASSRSVTSATPLVDEATQMLGTRLVGTYSGCREHTPTETVDELAGLFRASLPETVVAVGGSSVFDTVKAAAARFAHDTTTEPIPQIAVPTTLSAGEFTPGAGTTAASGSKQLIVNRNLLPRVVILDPLVTTYTPERLWLSSGVKAFEHAVEALWCTNSHPVIDALSLEAIRLLAAYLAPSRRTDEVEARAACQFAAWMSISSVSGSGIRLSHFIAHQVGAGWHVPHGITSGVVLPAVMRYLAPATADPQARIVKAMATQPEGAREGPELAEVFENFVTELDLPIRLRGVVSDPTGIEEVAKNAYAAAAALGLTSDLPNGEADIRKILTDAW